MPEPTKNRELILLQSYAQDAAARLVLKLDYAEPRAFARKRRKGQGVLGVKN